MVLTLKIDKIIDSILATDISCLLQKPTNNRSNPCHNACACVCVCVVCCVLCVCVCVCVWGGGGGGIPLGLSDFTRSRFPADAFAFAVPCIQCKRACLGLSGCSHVCIMLCNVMVGMSVCHAGEMFSRPVCGSMHMRSHRHTYNQADTEGI